ncbi:LysE family translocator [Falsiroseomonas oryziterrae]|uniref:LysE family translocator n=1 Tax=Falsiroseomonas oryziterrae TaxID=2911368 RepID=UPI001F3AF041|nr:LysE family translocator [Roseomonas sp. NPKOSM-4]
MPDWLPLLGFAIAGSVTPGPNVLMVAAASASHGVRAVLPHMLGITFGFGAMLLLVGLGLAAPLAASPTLHGVLRWVGAAWLLWLAWKIATAPPPGERAARPPLGFWGAAGFQWVNPKAWMLTAAAIPAFTSEAAPLAPQVIAIAAVFAAVSMPCLVVWAGIGAGTGRLLKSPVALRRFNIAMGVLLALSVLPLLR